MSTRIIIILSLILLITACSSNVENTIKAPVDTSEPSISCPEIPRYFKGKLKNVYDEYESEIEISFIGGNNTILSSQEGTALEYTSESGTVTVDGETPPDIFAPENLLSPKRSLFLISKPLDVTIPL